MYFGKEKSKGPNYKILKQKNVFIHPGVDRSLFLMYVVRSSSKVS